MGKKCVICNVPNRDEIEHELLEGMPKSIVAEELGITLADVTVHMRDHYAGVDVISPHKEVEIGEYSDDPFAHSKRTSYNKFDVLTENMMKLVNRFDVIIHREKHTKEDNDQLVNIAREIRQMAGALAVLEGEIRTEFELTQRQFDELKAFIIRELDPPTKKRLLEVISVDNIELVGEP